MTYGELLELLQAIEQDNPSVMKMTCKLAGDTDIMDVTLVFDGRKRPIFVQDWADDEEA